MDLVQTPPIVEEVKSADFTAYNHGRYIVVATCTVTDPASPAEGHGFEVFVRNGTATIGGTGYATGQTVRRVYHSGSWASYTPSAGAGTVTSVAVSGGTTGLTTSGGPITASGTITLAGTLAIANGGTGATTAAGATAAMNAMVGANGTTGGTKGLVPAPADTDNVKYLRGDGTWQAVSGGEGGINYITNGKAETDTSGWATYADAAGTAPVDGTGGSATTTWARSTTTPLRGSASFLLTKDAANRQGNGASCAFTIDSADCNKSLTISCDVSVASGTYAANDISVWVYDVTNSKLTPITGANGIVTGGNLSLQFSTNTSTNYRLIFHVASTSASAYTLKFDGITVGPQYAWAGPAMSDWQDGGAITITATTTNPTKGTVVRDKVWWKRVGDSAMLRYEYEHSTAGSAGSGDYLFTLPNGASFGTGVEFYTGAVSGAPFARIARGTGYWTEGTNVYEILAVPYDATRFRLLGWAISGASTLFFASGAGPLSSTAWRIFIEFHAPIAGWSGTTAVQPGSRYLWAQRFAATATRVTATPSKPGEYRARRISTDTEPTNAPSATDGFRIDSGSGIAAGRINQYDIYIGPGKVVGLRGYGSAGRSGAICTDLYVNTRFIGLFHAYNEATGVVSVLAFTSAATDIVGQDVPGGTDYTVAYFDFLVADDPVPVAQAPAVYVEAYDTSGQSCSGTTILQFVTEVTDTHGAWSGTVFTAPVAGTYAVNANLWITAATSVWLTTNGTTSYQPSLVTSASDRAAYSGLFRATAAGQTWQLETNNTFTRSTSSGGGANKIMITRIGD